MGGSISFKVLILGLGGAGKTHLLTFLEEGPNSASPSPSNSFETKEVKFKGVILTVYDVAGGEKVRELWKHYYSGTDIVVWVVDSTNPSEFQASAEALLIAIKDPEMKRDCPVLVCASKSDLSGSTSVEEITEGMKLDSLLKDRNWNIIKTDAKSGNGIHEGFQWLADQIKQRYKQQKKELKSSKENLKKY